MKVRCAVCDVVLRGHRCNNFWCRREDRGFDVVWAASPHRGAVRRAIAALKYRGDRQRVPMLAGLLVDVLFGEAGAFDDVDLIVGMPGLTAPDRPVDHIGEIVGALAAEVGDLWAIDLDRAALAKRVPTRSMVELATAQERRLWAAGELRASLVVPSPLRIRGARVLVVDDVLTDGSTLREAAVALRRAGACAVSGLVVARREPTVAKGGTRHPGTL